MEEVGFGVENFDFSVSLAYGEISFVVTSTRL